MKKSLILLMLAGFFLLGFFVSADAQTWSATQRLTYNSGQNGVPAAVVDSNDRIHLVWKSDTSGRWEIYYKKSTDRGLSWSSPVKLTMVSTDYHLYLDFTVATDNTLHLVWYDEPTSGAHYVYYKRSTDSGSTWSVSKRLFWQANVNSWYPAITTDVSLNVHVVWPHYESGYRIIYKRSTDNGVTWNPAVDLTPSTGNYLNPDIAVDSTGTVYVVYNSNTGVETIYLKKSTDSGSTWGSEKRVTWTAADCDRPHMIIDSNDTLHLTFPKSINGGTDIFYKNSTNGGGTWSSVSRMCWTNNTTSQFPKIAVDSGGTIHFVWNENHSNLSWDNYYKKSTDGGSTWLTTQRANIPLSYFPFVVVDSFNRIHLFWQFRENSGSPYKIFYKYAD